MSFSQKLQLILKTLKVTNKELAEAIGADASLISRWRTGDRKPTSSSPYIGKISAFITQRAGSDAQRIAILQLVGANLSQLHCSDAAFADLVADWLATADDSQSYAGLVIGSFLHHIDSTPVTYSNGRSANIGEIRQGELRQTEVFRGREGMQSAVLKLLRSLLDADQAINVMAFSDQSLDWLIRDPDYLAQWTALMDQCVRQGHTLEIVHTINRELYELFAIIEKWLPYYITDKVHPYYCPKYHESMFKRTFIAVPGICALTSHTVAGREACGEYEFSSNGDKIRDTEATLRAIMADSVPLIQCFVPQTSNRYLAYLDYHNNQPGDSIALLYTITSHTMPESIFSRNLKRFDFSEKKYDQIMNLFRSNTEQFRQHLRGNTYTEVVALPPPDRFDPRRIPVDTVPYLASHPMFFERKEDFSEHLENTIRVIQEYDNYHFYLLKKPDYFNNTQIMAKKGVGVVFTKQDWTFLTFVLKEQKMTNAFIHYLNNTLDAIPEQDKDKDSVIRQLRQYM